MKILILLVTIITYYAFPQSLCTMDKYSNNKVPLLFEYPSYCKLTENIKGDSISLCTINLSYMCYDSVVNCTL